MEQLVFNSLQQATIYYVELIGFDGSEEISDPKILNEASFIYQNIVHIMDNNFHLDEQVTQIIVDFFVHGFGTKYNEFKRLDLLLIVKFFIHFKRKKVKDQAIAIDYNILLGLYISVKEVYELKGFDNQDISESLNSIMDAAISSLLIDNVYGINLNNIVVLVEEAIESYNSSIEDLNMTFVEYFRAQLGIISNEF